MGENSWSTGPRTQRPKESKTLCQKLRGFRVDSAWIKMNRKALGPAGPQVAGRGHPGDGGEFMVNRA